jgi:hypothetical protein
MDFLGVLQSTQSTSRTEGLELGWPDASISYSSSMPVSSWGLHMVAARVGIERDRVVSLFLSKLWRLFRRFIKEREYSLQYEIQ